jgi:hypothetical protein
MNTKAKKSKLGTITRRLIVLPGLVVAVTLAFTAAASAQTAFQANVKAVPGNDWPCAGPVCGIASIAGYGPAAWTLDVLTVNPGGISPQCSPYTGVGTFQLLNGDGTLVLDEQGIICTPGNSGNAPRQDPFGAPISLIAASWNVDTTGVYGANTGVFAGLTGTGTDTGKFDGPALKDAYTGTLTPAAS